MQHRRFTLQYLPRYNQVYIHLRKGVPSRQCLEFPSPPRCNPLRQLWSSILSLSRSQSTYSTALVIPFGLCLAPTRFPIVHFQRVHSQLLPFPRTYPFLSTPSDLDSRLGIAWDERLSRLWATMVEGRSTSRFPGKPVKSRYIKNASNTR